MDGGINGMGRFADWPQIGLELRQHGWGATKVAEALNLPRETVRKWFECNAEPGYSSGLLLVRLHARVVSRKAVPARFAVGA